MKWINGETWKSKKLRRENWHKWFAWHPITVNTTIIDNKTRKVKVCFEYVERKAEYHYGFLEHNWKYREYGDIKK